VVRKSGVFSSKNTDQTGIHQQTAGFFPNFEFDFLLIHQKSEEYDKNRLKLKQVSRNCSILQLFN
jgi:hypothetical protein